MKIVGVVSELRAEPGLYARPFPERDRFVQEYLRWSASNGRALPESTLARSFVEAAGRLSRQENPTRLRYLFRRTRMERVAGPISERRSILLTTPLMWDVFADYREPLFHGLFRSIGDFRTVMTAEGGNVDLEIVDHRTANETWRRLGGGAFSPGLHLPHPKDPHVLVPANGYAPLLLEEVHAEWVSIFEALGAKRIEMAETTKTNMKARASVKVPTKGGADGEVELSSRYYNVKKSEYAHGTFDPERALARRRWIGDFPAINSAIEGRLAGSLSSWSQKIVVDTSFSVEVGVLKVVKGSVGVARTSTKTFEFSVVFYPRVDAR